MLKGVFKLWALSLLARAALEDSLVWRFLGPFPFAPRGGPSNDALKAPGLGPLGEAVAPWFCETAFESEAVSRDGSEGYPSELVIGAFIPDWQDVNVTVETETSDEGGKVSFRMSPDRIEFPEADWDSLQGAFGERTGGMFRSWVVGKVPDQIPRRRYVAQCTTSTEVRVHDADGTLGECTWTVLGSNPYRNPWGGQAVEVGGGDLLRARLVGMEDASFSCVFVETDAICGIAEEDFVAPDFVSGRLASPMISVAFRNLHPSERVVSVRSSVHSDFVWNTEGSNLSATEVPILPGQTMPLKIEMRQDGDTLVPSNISKTSLTVSIFADFENGQNCTVSANVTLSHYSFPDDAFQFTFEDYDGSLHYAAVRPPSEPCTDRMRSTTTAWEGGEQNGEDTKQNVSTISSQSPSLSLCPVLLGLHGAGVDVSPTRNAGWAGGFRQQRGAWLLLPTGRRKFGFDWQGVGRGNAFAALEALTRQLPGVPPEEREKYGVDPTRIVFSGHSMGGHGCWLMATRYADLALAAVPASGWIRFSLYSAPTLRVGFDYAGPLVAGILQTAQAPNDPALHVSNLLGLDVMVRIGTKDTNVIPWHMRRMARLHFEQGGNVTVSEDTSRAHWWGDVLKSDDVQAFFESHLETVNVKPPLPSRLLYTCVHPGECGSRAGFRLLQPERVYSPARVAMDLSRGGGRAEGGRWYLRSSNVCRLQHEEVRGIPKPSEVEIDGIIFPLWNSTASHLCRRSRVCRGPSSVKEDPLVPPKSADELGPIEEENMLQSSRSASNGWTLCSNEEWKGRERHGRTMGPLRQVMEWGPVLIVVGTAEGCGEGMRARGISMANGWWYRVRGALRVLEDGDVTDRELASHNLILLGGPDCNKITRKFRNLWRVPIAFAEGDADIQVKAHHLGSDGDTVTFSDPDTGVVFLAPHPFGEDNLMAVVGGTSVRGASAAASLLPLYSGGAIPDWLVVHAPSMSWQAEGGLLAGGFWDIHWQFASHASFVNSIPPTTAAF
uniref:Peptidase S9 prolyl oligopeptidase catalytic domain-containing protein n=1 Tax=Chromera velia CCMP2878 TaxID=1169474 RepID=A0A0G4HDA6_9ALVE|eukprot:Cvel_6423.t1-p1 / transcript=Cvel_6423.t1 / gene=Cvel_6423 / organism=Chromera_velia_CCMP2878 / gene_product=hypothetical protein / transcript_product=hypothetical protein / location=Cvel_scaffold314:47876-52542(-) / protein_length=1004 / sequence_SO=supercontig / SO=protein_coding / is_pseudo=false